MSSPGSFLIDRSGAKAIANSSGATAEQKIEGNGGAFIYFRTISSLTGKVKVSFDGGTTYIVWPSVNASDGTSYAANTTITTATDMVLKVTVEGATHVQFARAAGSATEVMFNGFPVTGSATGSAGSGGAGDASAANQATQITAEQALVAALGNVTSPISVSATLPVGDEGNATVTLAGAKGVMYEVTAVTGLHVTVESVLASAGTYRQVGCWQIASGVWRYRKPGTDITLASGDRIFVDTDAYAVRLKRASGTSATVTTRTVADPASVMAGLYEDELAIGTHINVSSGTLAAETALAIPSGATKAYVTIEETSLGTAAAARYTDDGSTTPTSTVGSLLKASNIPFPIIGADLMAKFKMINASGTAAASYHFVEQVLRG